jgi:hypothetical protein
MKVLLLQGLALFFAGSLSLNVVAQNTSDEQELGVFEHLNEYIPDDLVFVNQDYDTLNLKDAIDKPTVLVLVYYECPGICSPLLEGVSDVISKSKMQLGEDYQVFTVSFNPAESPRLGGDKKKELCQTGQKQRCHRRLGFLCWRQCQHSKPFKFGGIQSKENRKRLDPPNGIDCFKSRGENHTLPARPVFFALRSKNGCHRSPKRDCRAYHQQST